MEPEKHPTPLRHLAFILPNRFAVRNILQSGVPVHLAAQPDLRVTFLTCEEGDAATVSAFNCPHFAWRFLPDPLRIGGNLRKRSLPALLKRIIYETLHRLFGNKARYPSLAYRFNEIQGFVDHRIRKAMPRWLRQEHASVESHVEPSLGSPFPKSRLLYRLFSRLYFWHWGALDRVQRWYDSEQVDAVSANYIQFPLAHPHLMVAKQRGIPTIGMIGSWDNLALRGPAPQGLVHYLVQNCTMAQMLAEHHGIASERITVTGWPQMDVYHNPALYQSRAAFMKSLGLPSKSRILLLGANAMRNGLHEPDIAAHIAQQLQAGAYGDDAVLWIRPHPHDHDWQQRFGQLASERIKVQPPSYGDLPQLANFLKHSALTISTAGTIMLDGVALDTPAISLCFDGDQNIPPEQGCRSYYQFEHYAAAMQTGGSCAVESYEALDEAIRTTLAHPDERSAQRATLRAALLEPFDGRASERIVEAIMARL